MGRIIIYIAFSFLILSACSKEAKEEVLRIEQLSAFHSIELNDVFEVSLIEDTNFYVEMEGTPLMLDQMSILVEDSILKFEREKGGRWFHPKHNKIKLVIHSKPLILLTANQSCVIKTLAPITGNEFGLILKEKAQEVDLDLACTTFYYWNQAPCGGELKLNGQVENLKLWNFAIMTVDASNLQTNYALVENESKGDCVVNVSSKLEYRIQGVGNIQLYGAPSVIVEIEDIGEGELIQH